MTDVLKSTRCIAAFTAIVLIILAIAAFPALAYAGEGSALAVSTMRDKGANVIGKAQNDLVFDSSDDSEEASIITGWDVTGDGYADTMKLDLKPTSFEPGSRIEMAIYVNGKLSTTVNYGNWYTVDIVTLKNNAPFLFVASGYKCRNGHLLQYKNGKFKEVCSDLDLLKKKQGTRDGQMYVQVKGNTVIVYHFLQTYALGHLSVKYTYQYKKGTLQRAKATTFSIKYCNASGSKFGKPYVKTSKKFTAYKTTSLKKKAFTVKKNAKIQVTACKTLGNTLYLKIYNGKKSGWIRAFNASKNVSCEGYGKKPVIRGNYAF